MISWWRISQYDKVLSEFKILVLELKDLPFQDETLMPPIVHKGYWNVTEIDERKVGMAKVLTFLSNNHRTCLGLPF